MIALRGLDPEIEIGTETERVLLWRGNGEKGEREAREREMDSGYRSDRERDHERRDSRERGHEILGQCRTGGVRANVVHHPVVGTPIYVPHSVLNAPPVGVARITLALKCVCIYLRTIDSC